MDLLPSPRPFSAYTRRFMTFPFSAKKDLIDATARIYDMEPVPPILIEMDAVEPAIFVDGV